MGINECLDDGFRAHPPLPAHCLRQTIRLSLEEVNKPDGSCDNSIQNTLFGFMSFGAKQPRSTKNEVMVVIKYH